MILTTDNYHSIEANRAYVSHSQIKAWQDCPARWHAEHIAGTYTRPESDALIIGSYVDRAITEPKKFGAWAKAQDGILKKDGKPYAKFDQADEMIAALESCPQAMDLLTTGQNQAIVTATIGGVPMRIMADALDLEDERLVDLKTTRDLDDVQWNEREHTRQHWIDLWNYWQQMAMYRRVIEAATGILPDAWIVAADKGTPSRVGIYQMSGYREAESRMRLAEHAIMEAVAEMAPYRTVDAKLPDVIDGEWMPRPSRCGSCHYCRVTHVPQAMRWIDDDSKTGGKWTAINKEG